MPIQPVCRKPRVKPYDFVVAVTPQYLADQSEPDERQFVFAYTVRITNQGQYPAQVISRHWVITDGDQNVQEVRGLGVVGQQPLLGPGETFESRSEERRVGKEGVSTCSSRLTPYH